MEPETAHKFKVKSLSDLKAKAHKLVFAADPEFINRKDCYIGLQKYGIRFKEVLSCNITERYSALETGEASVFVGYESDPQIINEEVIKLADPDNFFPRYMAVPLTSITTLEKVPGLENALNSLHNIMTTDELNAIVQGLANTNNHPLYAKSEAEKCINKIGSSGAAVKPWQWCG